MTSARRDFAGHTGATTTQLVSSWRFGARERDCPEIRPSEKAPATTSLTKPTQGSHPSCTSQIVLSALALTRVRSANNTRGAGETRSRVTAEESDRNATRVERPRTGDSGGGRAPLQPGALPPKGRGFAPLSSQGGYAPQTPHRKGAPPPSTPRKTRREVASGRI